MVLAFLPVTHPIIVAADSNFLLPDKPFHQNAANAYLTWVTLYFAKNCDHKFLIDYSHLPPIQVDAVQRMLESCFS